MVRLAGVLSLTVTVKVQALVLPQASVAVQVTVVVPGAKVVPLAGLQLTAGFGVHESVAVGRAKVTTAPLGPVQELVMFVEQPLITGAVVSTTVTVWLQLAVLPQASVALQVWIALKVLPHKALVVAPTMVMVLVPQVSLVVGASNVHTVPHCTLLFATQVMVGAVVSTVVTVWLQLAVLPQASVAVHVRVAAKVLPQ